MEDYETHKVKRKEKMEDNSVSTKTEEVLEVAKLK